MSRERRLLIATEAGGKVLDAALDSLMLWCALGGGGGGEVAMVVKDEGSGGKKKKCVVIKCGGGNDGKEEICPPAVSASGLARILRGLVLATAEKGLAVKEEDCLSAGIRKQGGGEEEEEEKKICRHRKTLVSTSKMEICGKMPPLDPGPSVVFRYVSKYQKINIK